MPQRGSAKRIRTRTIFFTRLLFCLLLYSASVYAQQQIALQFTPANTSIKFTIADIVHTIHGSFQLTRGDVEYTLANGSLRGALVVDAASGRSGNRFRDHRMHHVVLDSGRYPEIIFRPDHVDGTVATSGASNLQVQGTFSIHGADHPLVIPVRLQVFPDHWIADAHFNIPYVRWGMKNPSSFFLRVSESVELDVHATGTSPFGTGSH
jgi:polyisoprenoid-binding protein YceI